MIQEKLKKEAQIRDWDHVFYVLSEDYLDEQGIEAILPPKLEEYIVRFTEDCCVEIKILGKFVVYLYVSGDTLYSVVGGFDEDGKVCGYSLHNS